MILLDGKKTSAEIKDEITSEVQLLLQQGKRPPHLVAVLVGNDGASETYVTNKVLACQKVGFRSTLLRFEDSISEEKLLQEIHNLNQDPEVDGFIVQLPLPRQISVEKVTMAILPEKDVDGFHPTNVGRMVINLPAYLPATPFGIMQLLERYQIDTVGKHCVVIGRSNIVGTPMSLLMAKNTTPGNCTVTICHSRTTNLPEICRSGTPPPSLFRIRPVSGNCWAAAGKAATQHSTISRSRNRCDTGIASAQRYQPAPAAALHAAYCCILIR